MARIRSIHPNLWTDEVFVTVSAFARLLAIALWNEADDQGVFEWRPITLKMRLLPADSVDVNELLGELAAANLIREFQAGDKRYGAVRNFARFQRPKKPNAVHPLPDELRTYAGLSDDGSEPPPPSGKRISPLNGAQEPRVRHQARTEAASTAPNGEPVGNQFRTGGEIEHQTESKEGVEGGVGTVESKSGKPESKLPRDSAAAAENATKPRMLPLNAPPGHWLPLCDPGKRDIVPDEHLVPVEHGTVCGERLQGVCRDICELVGLPPDHRDDWSLVADWLRAGGPMVDPERWIMAPIRAVMSRPNPPRPMKLKYFDPIVRESWARAA